jgi:hypothetical protein
MTDEPESPKKITYINKDTVFVLDSNLTEVETQNFTMGIDSNNNLHCFITNYSGLENKYYLNHWFMNSGSVSKNYVDSITGPEIETWYRSVKVVRNKKQELFLLSLKDSINIYGIHNNNLIKIRAVPFVDESEVASLYVTINDSLIHAIAWNYQDLPRYIFVDTYCLDPEVIYASIKHTGVELKINSKGFVYGLYASEIDGMRELSLLKSKIPLNPLPTLPPIRPDLECNDTTLCEGEKKLIHYSGVEIKWYEDETLIHIGDSLDMSALDPGEHIIKLSENILDFESLKDIVYVRVYANPENFLGNDTTIRYNTSLILNADSNYISYLWNGIEGDHKYTFDTKEYTIGTHTIELTVTDTNNCSGTEEINITVSNHNSISDKSQSLYKVFPNPTTGTITINSDLLIDRIFLLNNTGQILRIFYPYSMPVLIDLKQFSNEIFYLLIYTQSGEVFQNKIIKQ